MKHIAILVATIGLMVGTPYASAQKSDTQSPYAIEDCKSGCYPVTYSNSEGTTIYMGAVPRTFRFCSADGFGGTLLVDGKAFIVPGTSFGTRSCREVNALNIILTKGTLAVGPLP